MLVGVGSRRRAERSTTLSVTAVVGCHWGDEGKGKLIDYLAASADMVIRYNGGANAGHSIHNQFGDFALHLVPSGIFYPRVTCVVGPGTAVDPGSLLEELGDLQVKGIDTAGLRVSERAHVVMPYHKLIDGLEEAARGARVQGTTKRGIGPCYTDKVARIGVRMGDLLDPGFLHDELPWIIAHKNRVLTRLYDHEPLDSDALVDQCWAWGEQLRARIVDTTSLVLDAVRADKSIILEGQLGVQRDLDWGIYPYVTSSSAIAGGAAGGAGVPPAAITNVVGVLKAYTTSVGEGPFPTELTDAIGDQLREIGQEFGASTGRPRRCGWFDAVAARFAAELNGCTAMAIVKLDPLDLFPVLRICTAYSLDGQVITHMPTTRNLARVRPIMEEWPGWEMPTTAARRFEDLPDAARRYVLRLEELIGVPVRYVGVGAGHEALIIR
ncbi:MAG TPA: adenylosuccinate synthase [Chloroflexota bacterium]